MKPSEILELIHAGYTKADIDAMNAPEQTPAPVPASAQEQTPAPVPAPAQEQTPALVPAPEQEQTPESETEKLVKALGLKFDSLISAIQTGNVKTAERAENQLSADAALAQIINPNFGKET